MSDYCKAKNASEKHGAIILLIQIENIVHRQKCEQKPN